MPNNGLLSFPLGLSLRTNLVAVLALLAVLAALLAIAVLFGRVKWAIYAAPALSAVVLAWVLMVVMRSEAMLSTKPLAHFIETHESKRPVFVFKDFEELSSLPFYLQRPVGIIDSRSHDLFFLPHDDSSPLFLTARELEPYVAQNKIVVVVMDDNLANFTHLGVYRNFTPLIKMGESTVFIN